jgi:GST-like protein
MLEEIGLSYEAHLVDFNSDDQQTPEFPSLNSNIRFRRSCQPSGRQAAAVAP